MAVDRRTMTISVLTVLAAAAVGVAAGAVVGGREQTVGRATASVPTPAAVPTPAEPTTSAPASAAPSPTRSGPTVPVYVLGDTEAGPRLYREFRAVGGGGADPVRAAVAGLAETPGDPDYRTPWSGVRAISTSRAGTDVTVTFPAAPRLGSPAEATVAVQQVVHTVTAADPRTKRVRVVAPGLPPALTRAPLARAAQLDVLAPIWLLSPSDGGRSGRKLVLQGTASVFEATVSVEVRRGADVAAGTTATASVGAPGRGAWTATVTLPPGDYVVAAYEVSAKDGSRLSVDTKRVTVS